MVLSDEDTTMSIETEAQLFIQQRKEAGRRNIGSAVKVAREVMMSRLHASAERTEALNRLQEAELWAYRCLDEHGHK
jgi:hypothetical protein